MPPVMKVGNDIVVLFLSGDLHRETSDELFRSVDAALATGSKTVVLSFKNVTALLSEGIRSLVALHDHVLDAGKDLLITDLPKEVRYTLKITNLLDFLHHRESLESILADAGLGMSDLRDPKSAHPPAPPRPQPSIPAAPSTPATGSPPTPTPEKPKERILRPDQLKQLVTQHIRGRTAMAVVEFFIRHNKSVADLQEIVRATREDEKAIRHAVEMLAKRRVLKMMGANVFNFIAEDELHQDLAAMVAMWHTDLGRRKILPLLLAAEKA